MRQHKLQSISVCDQLLFSAVSAERTVSKIALELFVQFQYYLGDNCSLLQSKKGKMWGIDSSYEKGQPSMIRSRCFFDYLLFKWFFTIGTPTSSCRLCCRAQNVQQCSTVFASAYLPSLTVSISTASSTVNKFLELEYFLVAVFLYFFRVW